MKRVHGKVFLSLSFVHWVAPCFGRSEKSCFFYVHVSATTFSALPDPAAISLESAPAHSSIFAQ